MATTPYPYGRFIGRVGGLAVALGIGVAIANGAAIASADDGQSTGSGPSSSNADSGTSESGSASTGTSAASPSSPSSTSVGAKTDEDADQDSAAADTAESTSMSSSNDDDEADTQADDDDARDRKTSKSERESTVTSRPAATSAEAPANDTVTLANDTVTLAAPTTDSEPSSAEEPSIAAAPPATPGPAAPVTALLTMVGSAGREVDTTVAAEAVSPLGTPEQLAAERLAAETVNTLPVQLMKLFLRQGFLAAAQQQFALVGGPDAENLAALNNAVDEYAMAAAFQQQLLNPMTPTVVTQVAPPHTWYGMDVGGSRILYDNPDTIYRFMAVNKSSSYVITGRFTDGVPADTSFSVLEGLAGTTSSILTYEDLVVAPDGTFTITVSGDPAAPGQKNHLQLTASSTLIAARNTLADWNIEDPMSLSIERVAGPPNSLFAQLGGFVLLGPLVNNIPFLSTLVSLIPPLPIAEAPLVRGTFTALILAVRGVSEQSKYMALATTDPQTGQRRQPNVMSPPSSNAEFLANQLQSNGYFQLADDEVLVLTIDPGNAGYFVVPVYNDWTITDDYWNEQTSLNNAQARPDGDTGTYTIVISPTEPTDPRVWNWVSTGGLNQGTISIRFQDLDETSSDLPTVSSQVVSHDQLAAVLPPGTVLATPQDRLDQLALRKAGFNKRFAPFPQP